MLSNFTVCFVTSMKVLGGYFNFDYVVLDVLDRACDDEMSQASGATSARP